MRAVCFGLWPDGSTTTELFEGEGCLDRADAFCEAVASDSPDGLFAIAGDEAAARDRQRRLWADFADDPVELD